MKKNNKDMGVERIRGRIMKIKVENDLSRSFMSFEQAFYIDMSLRNCSNCKAQFQYNLRCATLTRTFTCTQRHTVCYSLVCMSLSLSHTPSYIHRPSLTLTHGVFLHAVKSFPPIPVLGKQIKRSTRVHSILTDLFSCHCNVISFKLK